MLSKYYYTKDGKITINSKTFTFKKMFRVNNYYYFYRVRFKNTISRECKLNTHNFSKLYCKNVRFYKKKKLIKTRIRYIFNLSKNSQY